MTQQTIKIKFHYLPSNFVAQYGLAVLCSNGYIFLIFHVCLVVLLCTTFVEGWCQCKTRCLCSAPPSSKACWSTLDLRSSVMCWARRCLCYISAALLLYLSNSTIGWRLPTTNVSEETFVHAVLNCKQSCVFHVMKSLVNNPPPWRVISINSCSYKYQWLANRYTKHFIKMYHLSIGFKKTKRTHFLSLVERSK